MHVKVTMLNNKLKNDNSVVNVLTIN